jgi:hypothetical protein
MRLGLMLPVPANVFCGSALEIVPASYYRTLSPPRPGYRSGYYDIYVVAYNPTTETLAAFWIW